MNCTHGHRVADPISAECSTTSDNVLPLRPAECVRRRLRRGEALCFIGQSLNALFVVRVGFLKSLTMFGDGFMQVTGFPMVGEVIGLDGIDAGRYLNEVVALDDAEVFVLPFAQFERWLQVSVYAQRLTVRTMALEIARSQDLLLLLGATRAEQRVALFLLDMSERYSRLGYSRSQFMLRMTRADVGSYLGLKIETVSRMLSRLHQEGVIQVQGKSIALLDFPALWRVSGNSAHNQRPAIDPIVDRNGALMGAKEARTGEFHGLAM